MAIVRACDRCGKKIRKESGLRINIQGFAYHRFAFIETDSEDKFRYGTSDLCPDCKSDYEAFMKGAEITRKEADA